MTAEDTPQAALGTAALVATLDDPTVTTTDQFGFSVAIEGNSVLVGARQDGTQSGTVGQAHLFDAVTGELVRTFDDPTLRGRDAFGTSVDIDAGRVLVGAPGDDTQGPGVGQAHLFDAATGTLLATFDDPTPTTRDEFGDAVAIDGDRVLIGARGDDTTGEGVGQAHLFDAATGALLATFDDPTPTERDNFGAAVAIDGDRVLIGALLDDTQGSDVGQAHLFDAVTGGLLRTLDDPTVTFRDNFAGSVAISGERVLIGAFGDDAGGGAGQAYLFDATSGALLRTFDDPTVTSFDQFGYAVALDGSRALIGARLDDTVGSNVGQAHLFDTDSGALLATFDDPTPTVSDQFGAALALDGGRVVIGALGDDTAGSDVGQAHLFALDGGAAPSAVNDAATTGPDTPVVIEVLANDTVEGEADLSVTAAGAVAGRAPENGTVAIEVEAVRYTPDPGFAGIDVFDYEVGDGQGGTDTGRVSVRVGTPEPSAGVTRGTAQDDALLIAQGSIYLAGAGENLFLLSPAARDNAVSVIDGQAGDTLQLVEGLEIASFLVVGGAIQFDLVDGAQVQVLGAEDMTFDVGGNVSAEDPGRRTDFAGFLDRVLGIGDPGDAIATGGFVTVSEDQLA